MKKGKRLISFILLIAVFSAGYFAGQKGVGASIFKAAEAPKTRTIEETISDYESAYNTGDFEKLLGCMSSSLSKYLSSALPIIGKIASGFLKVDISQDIMNYFWSIGAQSSQMNLTVHSIDYTGDTTADAYLLVAYVGAEELYRENGVTGICVKMNMVLENGDWKVASDFIPIDADYNKI